MASWPDHECRLADPCGVGLMVAAWRVERWATQPLVLGVVIGVGISPEAKNAACAAPRSSAARRQNLSAATLPLGRSIGRSEPGTQCARSTSPAGDVPHQPISGLLGLSRMLGLGLADGLPGCLAVPCAAVAGCAGDAGRPGAGGGQV